MKVEERPKTANESSIVQPKIKGQPVAPFKPKPEETPSSKDAYLDHIDRKIEDLKFSMTAIWNDVKSNNFWKLVKQKVQLDLHPLVIQTWDPLIAELKSRIQSEQLTLDQNQRFKKDLQELRKKRVN